MWLQIFAFCILHDDHGDCDEDDQLTIMWPQIFAFCVLHDDHGDCDEDDHLVVSDICMREFNRNVSLIDEGLVKSPLQKT